MMRMVLLGSAVALISGCSMIPGTSAYERAQAKQRVLYQLADADSAKFRNVRDAKKTGLGHGTCGEINAKNGFGAYTGFTPFLVDYNNKVFIVSDPRGAASESDMVSRMMAIHEVNEACSVVQTPA